jgi:hypothetical protein
LGPKLPVSTVLGGVGAEFVRQVASVDLKAKTQTPKLTQQQYMNLGLQTQDQGLRSILKQVQQNAEKLKECFQHVQMPMNLSSHQQFALSQMGATDTCPGELGEIGFDLGSFDCRKLMLELQLGFSIRQSSSGGSLSGGSGISGPSGSGGPGGVGGPSGPGGPRNIPNFSTGLTQDQRGQLHDVRSDAVTAIKHRPTRTLEQEAAKLRYIEKIEDGTKTVAQAECNIDGNRYSVKGVSGNQDLSRHGFAPPGGNILKSKELSPGITRAKDAEVNILEAILAHLLFKRKS